ncbi:MAG TPA: serpin family protein [Polyangiales bacterium]
MRRWVIATGLCSLLGGACTDVGNTGNPGDMSNGSPKPDAGTVTPPDGVTLLRSELARDTEPNVSDADKSQFAADQNALTASLFQQLSVGNPNLFFSPYSISTALAMAYAGAKGETKSEMAQALSFNLPEPALHEAFNATDLALAKRHRELPADETGADGFALNTLNAHFYEDDYDIQPAYLDVLARHYDSGAYLASFFQQPEQERSAINSWVRDQTEQRIDELLPPRSISATTVMVLVNAIYFKGSWSIKFDPSETKMAPFHAPDGDTSVSMMHKQADRRYARAAGYQAVELPYASDAVRMLLVLPDEGMQTAVEARLESGLFEEARRSLSQHVVDLRLPRFSFDLELDLIPALKELGMKSAFGPADFSGIGGPPGDLFVSGVFHQAFIGVDEQGTEAAAATAVVLSGRSPKPLASITFDRPFLFFIYDEPTGAILFAGRLSQP